MIATTERVHLRQQLSYSAVADRAAATRNQALLVDMEQMVSLLRSTKKKAAEARAHKAQEEARLKQEAKLAELRASLAGVQSRRERARADFEAELAAREEVALCKQKIAAEEALERVDGIEFDSVREGVQEQVGATAEAVDEGRAQAVRRAALQTREAVAAQVSSQTRWLSEELPQLLEAQARLAFGLLRGGGGGGSASGGVSGEEDEGAPVGEQK